MWRRRYLSFAPSPISLCAMPADEPPYELRRAIRWYLFLAVLLLLRLLPCFCLYIYMYNLLRLSFIKSWFNPIHTSWLAKSLRRTYTSGLRPGWSRTWLPSRRFLPRRRTRSYAWPLDWDPCCNIEIVSRMPSTDAHEAEEAYLLEELEPLRGGAACPDHGEPSGVVIPQEQHQQDGTYQHGRLERVRDDHRAHPSLKKKRSSIDPVEQTFLKPKP